MTEKDVKIKELNFFKDGSFYIHGFFDDTISKNITHELIKKIESEKNKCEADRLIKFYINSDGGFVCYLNDLLALIEKAKKEKIRVETYVFGRAYSCGSMLACSGTKGHRYISEFAEHLCHLGSASTGRVYNDTELKREAALVQAHFDFVRKLYKKYAKIKNLEKVISDDRFYIRGKNIIKNGLADKIF